MSSLITEKNGCRRIEIAVGGKRRRVRLGKISSSDANAIRVRINALAQAKIIGRVDADAERWCVNHLSGAIISRIISAGLLPARNQQTLAGLLAKIEASRSNRKAGTVAADKQTSDSLKSWFGDNVNILDITPAQAQEWRNELASDGLAVATIAKRTIRAKSIFNQAVKWDLIPKNPFSGLEVGSQVNRSRLQFVSDGIARGVLDACPDREWRAIFALARWGGLRIPSEIARMRWADIDWMEKKFRIVSPKTEHHEGQHERWSPLWPEVEKELKSLLDGIVLGESRIFPGRQSAGNMRTRMTKIIRRAGHKPWPRLFHQLRASRQTELAMLFPLHMVCRWIGNSAMIAQRHYLSEGEVNFAEAARNAARPPEDRQRRGNTDDHEKLPSDIKKGDSVKTAVRDLLAALGVEGLEPVAKSAEKKLVRAGCGAKSGALARQIVLSTLRHLQNSVGAK